MNSKQLSSEGIFTTGNEGEGICNTFLMFEKGKGRLLPYRHTSKYSDLEV